MMTYDEWCYRSERYLEFCMRLAGVALVRDASKQKTRVHYNALGMLIAVKF